MTYLDTATGLSPVAYHATLTEIRSVNDISNAAYTQAADCLGRRPQTADRRSRIVQTLSRLCIGISAMIALATLPMSAQGWDFLDIGHPLSDPLTYRRELFNGVVGIGSFAPNPGFEPFRLLHLHSTMPGNVAVAPFFEAILRLQTQNQIVEGDSKYLFGNTGIEFFSGSTINAGAQWHVGTIKGVTSGNGISTPPAAAIFKETDPQSPIDLRGGLAFFCSPSSKNTLPGTADQIEVMRVVNNRVGIKTETPLFPLQVINQIGIGTGNGLSTSDLVTGDKHYTAGDRGILTLLPGNSDWWYHMHNQGGSLLFSGGGTPTANTPIMGMAGNGDRVRIGCGFVFAQRPKIEGKFTISEDPSTNHGAYRSPIMMRIERRNDATYAASTPYKLISAGDNDKETFIVQSNGKVTIGKSFTNTTHTDYLLSVSGKVVCNDLRVLPLSGNWPDYVFSANHKLMSLEEVEQSVKANQHLPGMPSAKEVEANGIDIGEMQRKLLEKMEEMTLYMIELKKENVELRAKIDTINQPTPNK